jgi:hypothetical protein
LNPVSGEYPVGHAVALAGSTYTDETAAANNATLNDMTLFAQSPQQNDAYYFGNADPFTSITVDIATAGVGTWTMAWEYWNGSSWGALPQLTDNSSALTVAGRDDLVWGKPSDWTATAINGTSAYWIRGRISGFTSASTPPKGTQAWVHGSWDRNYDYFAQWQIGDTYKMWADSVSADDPYHLYINYRTSTDGLTWTQPNEGIVSYRGSTDTNILFPQGNYHESVYYDPSGPPSQRYVMVVGGNPNNQMKIYTSPDGIRFTLTADIGAWGYEGNGIYRRPSDGRWIVNYQTFLNSKRNIGCMLSDTSSLNGTWTDQGVVIAASGATVQKYSMGIDYHDGLFYGFVARFSEVTQRMYGVSLYLSRDGVHWTLKNPDFLDAGSVSTDWDYGLVIQGDALLKMGNEWRYYYAGTKYLHNHASPPYDEYLGLSTIGYERIGQVSGTGTITTNLLAATDDPDLHVNAGASGGTLRIALLDSSGSVLPGYSESDFDPIVTDTYDSVATWGGRRSPENATYKIRFYLTSATLYHYAVTGSASQTVQVTVARAAPSTPAAASAEHGGGGGGGGTVAPSHIISRSSSSVTSSGAAQERSSPSSCGSMSFADVPQSSWFAAYVYALATDGVVCGYRDSSGQPTGLFGPGNSVTEAEILKMTLIIGNKNVATNDRPKNLSARGDWSAPYVAEAERLGLAVYTPDLDIHRPATRGEVIKTVLEAFGVTIVTGANPFHDLPPGSAFTPAIETAYKLGLISGDTDAQGHPIGTVRPNAPVNRAEAAKIIAVAGKMLGNE